MLTLVGRSQERLDAARLAIEREVANVGSICTIVADITNAHDMHRVISEANAYHSRVTDHIVCAAQTSPKALFTEVEPAAMHAVMELNYYGVINVLKAALPVMVEKGVRGRIVLVSSVDGLAPTVDSALFTGSKFALRGLAEALRNEMILYGIQVCIFYPGSYSSPYPRKTAINETANLLTPPVGDDSSVTSYTKDGEIASNSDLEKQANALMNGLWARYFAITCSPSGYLTRMLGNGVSPRKNTPFELLVLPLLAVVQTLFELVTSRPPREFLQRLQNAGQNV
ncbi:hypothetical protein PINS_up002886 [Pythium insidiosum]|nr:hypothetical protein PINS_up002886 [Pythium insidiosum]